MTDLFASTRGFIRRADHHIGDLRERIATVSRDKLWTHDVQYTIEGDREVHKIRFPAGIFDDLPYIVFDAVGNLRAGLDHIAYSIGIKHTGSNAIKSAKFPFGPTEGDMLNNLAGGCKDLPAEIRALFGSFKPYKGGNDLLWALNELCNTKKHRIMVPHSFGHAILTLWNGYVTGPFTVGDGFFDWEKYEMNFPLVPEGTKLQYNASVTFAIAFDQVSEIISGQNPVLVLYAMRGEVERVLMTTEAECRRIGLIS
jgi:hypothetical protein